MVQHSQPFRLTRRDCWGLQGLLAQGEQDFMSQFRATESLRCCHSSYEVSLSLLNPDLQKQWGEGWRDSATGDATPSQQQSPSRTFYGPGCVAGTVQCLS